MAAQVSVSATPLARLRPAIAPATRQTIGHDDGRKRDEQSNQTEY